MPAMITQPNFAPQLTTLAMPLTNTTSDFTLQRGYMIWDSTYGILPGYSSPAIIQYLYNPSTVSSDFNIADASAQASLNFPNSSDQALLAVPLAQTASWTLMFDRTFELWGSYANGGVAPGGGTSYDPGVIGVQADVLAFMQFTGMMVGYQYGVSGDGSIAAPAPSTGSDLSANSGIMQLVPSWAVFGTANAGSMLEYYGYINEWSVQYTHWTQYNVPQRCVISVNWTMLPNPGTAPGFNTTAGTGSGTSAGVVLPGGGAGPGAAGAGVAAGPGR